MTAPTHDHTHGHKLTRNQALVLGALEKADGPLSAYSILDLLRDDGFRAPLQVYRALDKLRELGLVHRIESLNAFVSCAHPAGQAHGAVAFAICENCGGVTEFSRQDVVKQLADWARSEGFEAHATVIELRGLCGTCAKAA